MTKKRKKTVETEETVENTVQATPGNVRCKHCNKLTNGATWVSGECPRCGKTQDEEVTKEAVEE